MAVGFKNQAANRAEHDETILAATRCRIGLALQTQDYARVRALIQWVEQSHCAPKEKEKFQKVYSPLAGLLAGR
ncbi:MAG: hypothetical protein MZU97_18655 [Bacillus subtilis]|nr:hypothetical protein [Bacillus subtilis]